jgi:hypothetical protein
MSLLLVIVEGIVLAFENVFQCCETTKVVSNTPETVSNAMTRPLLHEYTLPPVVMLAVVQ